MIVPETGRDSASILLDWEDVAEIACASAAE
jgi:hypothetical protein